MNMNMTTEPTRIIGWISTAVTATIGVLVAFGLNLSDAQQTAVLSVIGPYVVLAIGMIEVIRSRVVSPASAGEAVAIAKTKSPDTNVVPVIDVAGYKEQVVKTLPGDRTIREIDWRPPVDNQ